MGFRFRSHLEAYIYVRTRTDVLYLFICRVGCPGVYSPLFTGERDEQDTDQPSPGDCRGGGTSPRHPPQSPGFRPPKPPLWGGGCICFGASSWAWLAGPLKESWKPARLTAASRPPPPLSSVSCLSPRRGVRVHPTFCPVPKHPVPSVTCNSVFHFKSKQMGFERLFCFVYLLGHLQVVPETSQWAPNTASI